MNRPTPGSSGNLLIVEGVDDKYVAIQIAIRLGSVPQFCAFDRGPIEELLRSVEFDVRLPGCDAIGFLVDADDNPMARWDAVSNRLRNAGVDAPGTPDSSGTIIDATDEIPRVGVWMMPDNQSRGELEDFVAEMIPDNDPVWPLSRDYVRRIPDEHREFAEHKTSTAELYAWLATREDPRRMGEAIRDRYLDIDGALCTRFTDWLERLFV